MKVTDRRPSYIKTGITDDWELPWTQVLCRSDKHNSPVCHLSSLHWASQPRHITWHELQWSISFMMLAYGIVAWGPRVSPAAVTTPSTSSDVDCADDLEANTATSRSRRGEAKLPHLPSYLAAFLELFACLSTASVSLRSLLWIRCTHRILQFSSPTNSTSVYTGIHVKTRALFEVRGPLSIILFHFQLLRTSWSYSFENFSLTCEHQAPIG